MPIYEFYCPDCHTLFSFFSQAVLTEQKRAARPECPRCRRPDLSKRPSRFAMVSALGGGEEGDESDELFAGLDEARVEGAMDSLASEFEAMGDDDDPRAASQLLRRFGELSGLELGPRMEEALQRMEAGEDPDAIEEEMGDDDSLEDLFQIRKRVSRAARRPSVDDTLYFL